MTREVQAPKGRYSGRHKVYATVYRDWNKLCQNRPGPMRRCYIELADNPFPGMQTNRHHQCANCNGVVVSGVLQAWSPSRSSAARRPRPSRAASPA